MYRLAVFPLAERFLENLNRHAGTQKRFSPAFLQALDSCRRAGNVRELKNTVERNFILADDVLGVDLRISLPGHAQESVEPVHRNALQVPLGSRLDEAERSLIEGTLDYCDGDKRRAAAVLGCSLKALYNKLNSYGRVRRPSELTDSAAYSAAPTSM